MRYTYDGIAVRRLTYQVLGEPFLVRHIGALPGKLLTSIYPPSLPTLGAGRDIPISAVPMKSTGRAGLV